MVLVDTTVRTRCFLPHNVTRFCYVINKMQGSNHLADIAAFPVEHSVRLYAIDLPDASSLLLAFSDCCITKYDFYSAIEDERRIYLQKTFIHTAYALDSSLQAPVYLIYYSKMIVQLNQATFCSSP